MFSSMQTKTQSQLPDFSQLFESIELDFPDVSSLLADKFPEMTEFESLMPDMTSMFTASLPKTEDIERAMPDFDMLTSELASISPMSQLEGLSLPTPEAVPESPKFDIDYDAFGSELTKSITPPGPTAEEKESMMARAEPTEGATLNDLKDQLVQLNTNILELITHSAASAENTGAAVKATRDLNGNLFA